MLEYTNEKTQLLKTYIFLLALGQIHHFRISTLLLFQLLILNYV
jgi:hypothetical protein